jgi:hypothetical protein
MKKGIASVILGALWITSALAETGVTQQPTLADYKDGEKWIWKYKGVTTAGEIRSEGKDTKQIISQNGVLKMVTQHETIPLANIVKPVKSKTPRYSWPLQVGKKMDI